MPKWEYLILSSWWEEAERTSDPQGNNGYGSFPVHRLFFKRPAPIA